MFPAIRRIKGFQEQLSPAPYHIRPLLRRRCRRPKRRRTIRKYTLSPALLAPSHHDRYRDGEPPQMGNPLRAPRHAAPSQPCCRGGRASRASLDDACDAAHDPHKAPEYAGWQNAYPCESLRLRRQVSFSPHLYTHPPVICDVRCDGTAPLLVLHVEHDSAGVPSVLFTIALQMPRHLLLNRGC